MLGRVEFGLDRRDHPLGDLVLHCKEVRELAIPALGPDVVATLCLDELGADAHPVAGFAHAAFKHIAYAQFAADLRHIDRAGIMAQVPVTARMVNVRQATARKEWR